MGAVPGVRGDGRARRGAFPTTKPSAGPRIDVADPPHRTRFSVEYDDERRARIVATSLDQEVGEIDDDRSRTSLARDGRTVEVVVAAADLVALRAATNTWLSLLSVAERTAKLAG